MRRLFLALLLLAAAWTPARAGDERTIALSSALDGAARAPSVLLGDSLGEMWLYLGAADVAFVGGSLFPGRNGQNMMEPSAFGASVLFGPHTGNFREAVEGLLDRGFRVTVPAGLTRGIAQQIDAVAEDYPDAALEIA